MSTPLRLYKYCSSSTAKKIIEGRSLRFSPISAFNDPFDCLAGTSHLQNPQFIRERMEGLIQNGTIPPDYDWAAFQKGYFQKLPLLKLGLFQKNKDACELFRILCLSLIPPDDPRALLLWAHYAKETASSFHDGIVLEFDGRHKWVERHQKHSHNQNEPIIDAGEVKYPDSLERPSPPPDSDGRFYIGPDVVFTKSSHWAYEAEYRLLRETSDPLLRKEPVDSLLEFPPDLLIGMTFGLNTTDRTEHELRQACSTYPKVEFKRATRVHPEKYQLIVEDDPTGSTPGFLLS